MRIGELAERTGASVRSLRYYEEQGLLAAARSPSGQRHYGDEAVERVRFVRRLYAAGLSSRDVALLLPCVDRGRPDAPEREMLDDVRVRLLTGIGDLEAALRRLDGLIAAADAA